MTRETTNKVVYIVDDSRPLREIYREILTEEGYLVTTFSTGEDALARMPSLPIPNLLLVDHSLVTMQGEEFVALIRSAMQNHPKFSIAGFSNYPPGNPQIAAFKNVVDVYFEKTSDIDELAKIVMDLLA